MDVLSERMSRYTFAKPKGMFRDTIISQIRTNDDDPSSLEQYICQRADANRLAYARAMRGLALGL